MNNTAPTVNRSSATTRGASRRAMSTISLLVAMSIGAMVIAGFTMFWVNGNKFQQAASDTTRAESAGLAALNRISKDVSESSAVLAADHRQLVLAQSRDGDRIWVRYAVTEQGNLYKQTLVDPPAAYDAAANPFGAPPTRGFIATGIVNPEDGSAFFTYTAKDGNVLAGADVPAFHPGNATRISLIDISYAAKVKGINGEGNTVELHTSASVETASGTAVAGIRPACPIVTYIQAYPHPIFKWDMVGQASQFRIYRVGDGGIGLDNVAWDGSDPTRVPLAANFESETYEFADPEIVGATEPINYTITAFGSAGESLNCAATRWTPRLASPVVSAELIPDTATAPDGPGPDGWPVGWNPTVDSSEVRLSWPQIGGARYYEVYRRPLTTDDPASGIWDPAGSFTLRGSLRQPTDSSLLEYIEPVGEDVAYAYRVVAWGTMPEPSRKTSGVQVLSHTATLGSVAAKPTSPGVNRVTWNTDGLGSTATRVSLWRRDTSGCFTGLDEWTEIGDVPLGTGVYVDNSAARGSAFEYGIVAHNFGPRGTKHGGGATEYAARFATGTPALQYPQNPTIERVEGTNGADYPNTVPAYRNAYQNRVFINPGCAATSTNFDIEIYDRYGAGVPAYRIAGNVLANPDAAQPDFIDNATRASRRWYKAVATNATGTSTNASTDMTDGSVSGIQWPNRPATPTLANQSANGYPVTVYKNPGEPTAPADGSPCAFVRTDYTVVGGVSTPQRDVYSCTRYDYTATYTWTGSVADDGIPGETADGVRRWCATTNDCYYRVEFDVRNNNTGTTNRYPCTVRASAANPTPTSCQLTYAGSVPSNTLLTPLNANAVQTVWNGEGSATSVEAPVLPPMDAAIPTDPVFKVVGSASNADGSGLRDAGRNSIYWAPVNDATAYQVWAYRTYTAGEITDAAPRLVYSGPAVNNAAANPAVGDKLRHSIYDTHASVARGTETYYRVTASNSFGTSPGSKVKLPAYQLPDAPTMMQVGAWNPDGGTVRWSWTATADAGQPAGAYFCGLNRGECSQTLLVWNKTTLNWLEQRPIPYGTTQADVPLIRGESYAFGMRVCNAGGCVQTAITECTPSCELAPGPFTIVDSFNVREQIGVKYSVKAPLGDFQEGTGRLAPRWTAAEGAVRYRVARTVVSSTDPLNRVFPAGYTGTLATAQQTPATQPRRAPGWDSTPSAVYEYHVYAEGNNGIARMNTYRILARPPQVLFGQATIYCKRTAASDGDWKMGYKVHPDAVSFDQNVRVDRVKQIMWAGRLTQNEWDNTDVSATALTRAHISAGLNVNSSGTEDDAGIQMGDYENGYIPGGYGSAGNWDRDWRAADWDNPATRPGFSDPGSAGLWKSSLPGGDGIPEGGVMEGVFGDQDDAKALPTVPRIIAVMKNYTWLDPGSYGGYNLNAGVFLTGNAAYGFPRPNGSLPSADGNCGPATSWRANLWEESIGRYASKYTGYTANNKYGERPDNDTTYYDVAR